MTLTCKRCCLNRPAPSPADCLMCASAKFKDVLGVIILVLMIAEFLVWAG